jgi:antagonist of KipI
MNRWAERPAARLRILKPGLFTTVQDLGRFGYQRFGMSVGGAMDRLALRLANRLVGNPDQAAALEITVRGPELAFDDEAVIALTGADLSPSLDGQPQPNWTTVRVGPGSTLSFGERRSGARAYLALAGGIDVPLSLGSRSTHTRSRTGGLEGRALVREDELRGGAPSPSAWQNVGRSVSTAARPPYSVCPTLRVVLGPQADCFVPEAVERLTAGSYLLSPQSDRMGYRLVGAPLVHAGATDMISDATPCGSVQVPASRQPILLMADCQTTGGYPKIAVVISADLPLAAQLVPGDRIKFSIVTIPEARAALRAQRDDLDTVLLPQS